MLMLTLMEGGVMETADEYLPWLTKILMKIEEKKLTIKKKWSKN